MNKLFIAILSAICLLSLAACQDNNDDSPADPFGIKLDYCLYQYSTPLYSNPLRQDTTINVSTDTYLYISPENGHSITCVSQLGQSLSSLNELKTGGYELKFLQAGETQLLVHNQDQSIRYVVNLNIQKSSSRISITDIREYVVKSDNEQVSQDIYDDIVSNRQFSQYASIDLDYSDLSSGRATVTDGERSFSGTFLISGNTLRLNCGENNYTYLLPDKGNFSYNYLVEDLSSYYQQLYPQAGVQEVSIWYVIIKSRFNNN